MKHTKIEKLYIARGKAQKRAYELIEQCQNQKVKTPFCKLLLKELKK